MQLADCKRLIREEKYKEAADNLKNGISKGQRNIGEWHFWLATCYLLLNENSKAIEFYDKAIASSVDNKYSDAHYNKAVCLSRLNKYEEAISSCEKAIADSPSKKNPSAFFSKGAFLLKLDKYEEAITAFDKAIEDSPEKKYPIASSYKGGCLEILERFEEAIIAYDKAIEDSPDNKCPDASYNKGKCLKELGYYEEAIIAYDKAIEDSPDNKFADASLGKGNCLNKLERFEEAIIAYDKAIEDSPGNIYPLASNNKGNSLNGLERFEEAIIAYDKAIEGSPGNIYPLSFFNKGSSLYKLNRYEEAIIFYDKTVKYSSDSYCPWAWLYKSKAFFALNKISEARHAAFQALSHNNTLKNALTFIVANFSKEEAYTNRIRFLDLLLMKNIYELVQRRDDIRSILKNVKHSGASELYGELLLEKADVLNTGKPRYERLRISYLIFASSKAYEWVFYIIDYLLDDGNYKLDHLDYYFYLTAAFNIAASKQEVEDIILEANFSGLVLKPIDEYLYQLESPLVIGNLDSLAKNETEREILGSNIIMRKPYEPALSIQQLSLISLAVTFQFDAGEIKDSAISGTAYLNLKHSLSFGEMNAEQVSANIDSFIDGTSTRKLAHALFLLTNREEHSLNISYSERKEITLLKAFVLVKYQLKKQELSKQELANTQFIYRGLVSTLFGNLTGGIASISIFVSLGLTYAIEFCMNLVDAKMNRNFTWGDFLKALETGAQKSKLEQLLI